MLTETTKCVHCGHTGDHDDNDGFCKVCGKCASVLPAPPKPKKVTSIVFSLDKNGRRIAYRVGNDYRLFRIGLEVAAYLLESGKGEDVSDGWKDYFARLKRERTIREHGPSKRCDLSHTSDAAAYACGCYE